MLFATAPAAMASEGSVSVGGSVLKVKGENDNLAGPGDLPDWRNNYIYIRVADATNHGWDGTPGGVDVTGKYRVFDVFGGHLLAGSGCIPGMTAGGNEANTLAYCDPATVKRISIKTGNGNDSVKLEHLDPLGSVPSAVSSVITTGKGHDGVWGGDGSDKINTGNDNDGGIENVLTQAPESVNGYGGDDQIILGNGDTFNTDGSPVFPIQEAFGGNGNDKLSSKYFFNTLHGDAGDDVLTGSKYGDILIGDQGADIIKGYNGDDEIDASEVPAQADLLIDCGKDSDSVILDVGVDPAPKNCE
jgi:hypothetical protein